MQSRAIGFRKMSMDEGHIGGLLGGGVAFMATPGRHQIARIGASVLGYQAGSALASGVGGAVKKPDLTGLTDDEKRVVRSRVADIQASRRRRRLAAVGAGVGSLLLTGDPLVLLAAIPAATIHPYSAETRYISELADHFRAARSNS